MIRGISIRIFPSGIWNISNDGISGMTTLLDFLAPTFSAISKIFSNKENFLSKHVHRFSKLSSHFALTSNTCKAFKIFRRLKDFHFENLRPQFLNPDFQRDDSLFTRIRKVVGGFFQDIKNICSFFLDFLKPLSVLHKIEVADLSDNENFNMAPPFLASILMTSLIAYNLFLGFEPINYLQLTETVLDLTSLVLAVSGVAMWALAFECAKSTVSLICWSNRNRDLDAI